MNKPISTFRLVAEKGNPLATPDSFILDLIRKAVKETKGLKLEPGITRKGESR